MGNDNSEIKKILNNFKEENIDLKNKIIDYINFSHSNIHFENSNDIINWKVIIINFINKTFNEKYDEIKKKFVSYETIKKNSNTQKNDFNENVNYKEELNNQKKNKIEKPIYFNPKEIQNRNLQITREFESYSFNFINDEDDKIDNQTLGEYLMDVAKLSRISLKESNKFLGILYGKFNQSKDTKEVINISFIDEFRIQFSTWVKKNSQLVNSLLQENFQINLDKIPPINNQKDPKKKNYFHKLYKELFILYFQCELSYPPIEINFSLEDEVFNSSKMIDPFNQSTSRKKVNFVYFPSLISNGNFIENGKQWVFTTYYNKKKEQTFFYQKNELEKLDSFFDNKEYNKKKFRIPTLSDKLLLTIREEKYLIPNIPNNYKLSDKVNYGFIFHIKDKKKNIIEEIKSEKFKLDENKEFIKCDFILMGKIISSFSKKEI